jgi:hypothetical protein
MMNMSLFIFHQPLLLSASSALKEITARPYTHHNSRQAGTGTFWRQALSQNI